MGSLRLFEEKILVNIARSVRVSSHQARSGCESEKDQRTSKKDQGINGKHQRKFSFSRSLSLNTA